MNAEACLTQRSESELCETLENLFLLSFLSFSCANMCADGTGAVPVEVISLLVEFSWEINFNFEELGWFIETLENIQNNSNFAIKSNFKLLASNKRLNITANVID